MFGFVEMEWEKTEKDTLVNAKQKHAGSKRQGTGTPVPYLSLIGAVHPLTLLQNMAHQSQRLDLTRRSTFIYHFRLHAAMPSAWTPQVALD
ncbi:hypothetical protein ACLOJK_000040 [Asimina triloba]